MTVTDKIKIDGIIEKIKEHGNEETANALKDVIRKYEDMVYIDGGEYWDTFIKGYLRCLLKLGFINDGDVTSIYGFLFEKYVDVIKSRHS